MKLVYAIVNSDDTYAVNKGLLKAGIRATKLSSTGGFLMSGNTTFLICCPDEQVDLVIEVCKSIQRKESSSFRHQLSWSLTVRLHILLRWLSAAQLFSLLISSVSRKSKG